MFHLWGKVWVFLFIVKNATIKTIAVSFFFLKKRINIDGRLAENNPNSFVDLHSQKDSKRKDQKFNFLLYFMINFD